MEYFNLNKFKDWGPFPSQFKPEDAEKEYSTGDKEQRRSRIRKAIEFKVGSSQDDDSGRKVSSDKPKKARNKSRRSTEYDNIIVWND